VVPADPDSELNGSTTFDVVVIGSGPAGHSAALQAARLDARVALIDRENRLGGVSLLSGTVPSKTLREAILYLRGVRQRSFYGSEFTEQQEITVSDLLARVRKVVDQKVEVGTQQLEQHGVTVLRGYHATLESATSVHAWLLADPLESVTLEAKRIIVATGSTPRRIPNIAVDNEVIFDSDSIFALDEKRTSLPRSLVVIGGGVIGTEYAAAFAALGCKVWLVHRSDVLLPSVDRSVVALLSERMVRDGVEFVWNSEYKEVSRTDEGTGQVTLEDGRVLIADAVVVAMGREVASKVLGLDDVGVETARYGLVKVNELFQTSVASVYAVGDVIGFPSLASTGFEQGRMAASYALGRGVGSSAASFPMCIYTIPEIAMVGQTEEELDAKSLPYSSGVAHYRDVTKASILGDEDGMLKLLFDPSSRTLLGVHIIGDQASELIHIGQAVLRFNGTVDYFIESVFNFPTLAEAYKLAAINGLESK
jgi:NAD(P) transhydrogenase